MKNSLASGLLVTLCLLNAAHESRAVAAISSHGDERRLESDMKDFKPLDCNPASFDGVNCSSWMTRFGSDSTHNDLKIIPCNECIKMDIVGGELVLNGGLDIQGKLLFEDGYKLILRTTHIVVQGELEMKATRAVTDNHDVEFILFGKNTELKFDPLAPNSNLNSAVGKKSITVAGGKINIRALPNETPTWVKLFDTVSENGSNGPTPNALDAAKLTFTPNPATCSSTNVVSETFANGVPAHPWSGSLGAQYTVDNSVGLIVYDRKGTFHGPEIDLRNIETGCLVPGRTYLIAARIAYAPYAIGGHGNSPLSGNPTECAQTDQNCLEIWYEYMTLSGSRRSLLIAKERASYSTKIDEDFVLAAEISFTATEVDRNNIFGSFRINGVDATLDIFLKEFSLSLPPQGAYPSPASGLCSNLVTANGDADAAGLSPFPFYSSHKTRNVVAVRDGADSYFQVTGESTSNYSGLMWSVPASCVEKAAKYLLFARVRVNSGSGKDGKLRFWWRAVNPGSGSDVWLSLMDCPLSTNSAWVDCSGVLTVPPEMDTGNEEKYDIFVQTLDADEQSYPSVNYDVTKLSFALQGGAPIGIVIDKAVKGKWGIGAEILLTSHTNRLQAAQVRSITEINDIPGDDQHVAVIFHDSFQKPIVEKNNPHPQTAVEVALLSRTIQFSGELDEALGVLHGCHLWVKNTPTVIQTLEGVGFAHCGQQGNLGRYPIHFHMSKSVLGSIVSKNLVRDSFQRGIVVHGTDYLQVRDNVLYNTRGHGFLLEDGIEQFNTFAYNLAASTMRVEKLISSKESDNKPSSYWITNPTNNFVGNVAAGSESAGFWFELQVRGKMAKSKVFASSSGHPQTEPLLLFSDNVSHSNHNIGLRTYPHKGYSPDVTAEFLRFSSFRNLGGILFLNSKNMNLVDSFLADNIKGLHLQNAENILLQDSEVIGVTPGFLDVIQTQNVNPPCNSNAILGMSFHTFTNGKKYHSIKLENVAISGFDNTGCDESYLAEITAGVEVTTGEISFDALAVFEATQYNGLDHPARIDFCPAERMGVIDVYLTDKNSALGPASASGTSTIISNTPTMTTFVQDGNCENARLCSRYCKNTIFHTIKYAIPYPHDTGDYKLKICDMANPSKCVEFGSVFKEMKAVDATRDYRTRHFNVHLPSGDYSAVFVDGSGSNKWPTSVQTEQKGDLIAGVNMNLNKLIADCQNLIKNGDLNKGAKFWTHRGGGVTVQGGALTSLNTNSNAAFSQWLDTRCIEPMQGRKYEITARVRMENGGKSWLCKPNADRCPRVWIRTPSQYWEAAKMVSENGVNEGDYQLVYGVFEIRPEMLGVSQPFFQIDRNIAGKSMFVKDIVMKLLPEVTNSIICENNLVLNGNFDTGDSRHWEDFDIAQAEHIGCDDNAGFTFTSNDNERNCAWIKMKFNKRKSYCEMGEIKSACALTCGNCQEQNGLNFSGSLSGRGQLAKTRLHHGCMNEGERYFVKAKFMVVDRDGHGVACNNNKPQTNKCPELALRSDINEGGAHATRNVARAVGSQLAGSWNELYGEFNVSPKDVSGDYHLLYLHSPTNGQTYILDNFEVQKMSKDSCSELIFNGNLDIGFAGVFEKWGNTATLTNVQDGNTGAALQVSNRQSNYHGLKYKFPLDFTCFNPGATFQVSADLKMLDESGNGAPCLTTQVHGHRDDACPAVRIELLSKSNNIIIFEDFRGYAAEWNPAAFNKIMVTFTLPQTDDKQNPWNGDIRLINVGVRGYNSDYTLILDNLSMKKLSGS